MVDAATPLPGTAPPPDAAALRLAVRRATRADETACVTALLGEVNLPEPARRSIAARAARLVEGVRRSRRVFGGLDDFLQEFGLSTQEGIALMCLAEALLRIPDAETADRLIRDKLTGVDWERHVGQGDSLFVNASTWALMLTGRVIELDSAAVGTPAGFLGRLVARAGEPVIRQAMIQAMRVLGRQFVMGRTIDEALKRARGYEKDGYTFSYDMLGEGARTAADAERYFASYVAAIDDIGAEAAGRGPVAAPGISVKLSALHPRYEYAQRERAVPALVERLVALAAQCRHYGIGLTVDAEEADRLDLSLDIVEAAFLHPEVAGWDGFGLAVQAYQKRAAPLIDWLADLARRGGRRLMVRLVKGAYWDSEIKRAQERGLDGYPVFTRKPSTDVSYLACAARLLRRRDQFYPQFATHNAQTVAAVIEMAGAAGGFEFQRLHGMGEPLYHQLVGPAADPAYACRVYAPVGSHEELLPYLVRRLLENGANTSFVNRLRDDALPVEEIVADPVARVAALAEKPHPRIPLPRDLYRPDRANSEGADLGDPRQVEPLLGAIRTAAEDTWTAAPIIDGSMLAGAGRAVRDPADRRRVVGRVLEATADAVERAMAGASRAFADWSRRPAEDRAACLDRAAALLERERAPLMALLIREGGKTIPDALAEVREAADFCRYYASQARDRFARPLALPGPTGESNSLALKGRGVFACISPWNFPLAIFTGQVAAALAAGNAVVAKPAEQTPLVGALAVRLLHEAGVPGEVLQFLPGSGETVGATLVRDPRLAGVAFTGSTETARAINRSLAERAGPIVPFIAETGGQNAMIVDSSALPEQVVDDVLASAFRSAGQRCSALRALFLQADAADRVIDMLRGAAETLVVGDPMELATDLGPAIDEEARAGLDAHIERMSREARRLFALPLGEAHAHGTFVAPHAFEIDGLARLEREVFGPILHVVRYAGDRLDDVIEAINASGYGLTLGIHTRIDAVQRHIVERVRVGNVYVNRNIIGAVVGVQPFGGEGLSGTGPKAGGPHYLTRFATERTLTVNTTAAGGNTTLVTMAE